MHGKGCTALHVPALTYLPVLLLVWRHLCFPQALALPPAVAAEVDMATLVLRAQPFRDADALLPICYRCQATNALLNTQVSHVDPVLDSVVHALSTQDGWLCFVIAIRYASSSSCCCLYHLTYAQGEGSTQ
jgi:hypothetical protein